jgi:probable HAF family extracellular repeat protein
MIDLGTLGGATSYAQAVNDRGQVVGGSALAGDGIEHAFVWSAGHGMTDLGPSGRGSGALAVTDTGLVLGGIFSPNRAALWYVGPPWGFWERQTGFGGSRCSWNSPRLASPIR